METTLKLYNFKFKYPEKNLMELQPYQGWAFPGLLTDEGCGEQKALTMMKLGTVIP